jgi:hypothetical protein
VTKIVYICWTSAFPTLPDSPGRAGKRGIQAEPGYQDFDRLVSLSLQGEEGTERIQHASGHALEIYLLYFLEIVKNPAMLFINDFVAVRA